jgi:RNA polymerase sigma-70 factor (ECF subfamily)
MEGGRYSEADLSALPGPETAQLESFRDRLRIFAARRTRDWAAAEDVAQEAIGRALEAMRAGRIENLAALPSFLFKTALRLCFRRTRSAGREARALQKFGAGDEAEAAENPLTALLSAERRSSLRRAFERLEPDERRLLEMTYRDELDSEEIGRRLGLSAGAVRVRRHRAIRRLADLLGVTKQPDRALEE